MQKEIVKYDEKFKTTVVEMLASGELKSIEKTKRIFNIKGSGSISKWIKKYIKK